MQIEFPERYRVYLGLLIEEGIYDSKSEVDAASALFRMGLDDAVEDVTEGGEPDMYEGCLDGARMIMEIPDDPIYTQAVKAISEQLGISIIEASAIPFVYGLSLTYVTLVNHERYGSDPIFRRHVDQMPHEHDEEPGCNPYRDPLASDDDID